MGERHSRLLQHLPAVAVVVWRKYDEQMSSFWQMNINWMNEVTENISPSKYRLSFYARFVFHSIFIMFLILCPTPSCLPVTHRKKLCYEKATHVCVCVVVVKSKTKGTKTEWRHLGKKVSSISHTYFLKTYRVTQFF
jgi:hypothetical protein